MRYKHAIDRLAIKLAGVDDLDELIMDISDEELAEDEREGWEALGLSAPQILEIKLGKLERVPGKQNWVDKSGGLDPYLEEVANSIHEKRGKSISNSIQIAWGVLRNWCRGQGKVKPDTRAKACKAIANMDRKRASSKAKTAAKKAT